MLNKENIDMIRQKKFKAIVCPQLFALKKANHLNQETSEYLSWEGPAELQTLNHRIHQMVAYGIYLLDCDVSKGKTALLLGLELKKELKQFFELPNTKQAEELTNFKKSFLTKLHSKDAEMAIHRSQWKMIVANIAIAFTGIGLLALGIHYALTGQAFFSPTQRQKLVQDIAETEWLGPS